MTLMLRAGPVVVIAARRCCKPIDLAERRVVQRGEITGCLESLLRNTTTMRKGKHFGKAFLVTDRAVERKANPHDDKSNDEPSKPNAMSLRPKTHGVAERVAVLTTDDDDRRTAQPVVAPPSHPLRLASGGERL